MFSFLVETKSDVKVHRGLSKKHHFLIQGTSMNDELLGDCFRVVSEIELGELADNVRGVLAVLLFSKGETINLT